jgi:hypothetical protein
VSQRLADLGEREYSLYFRWKRNEFFNIVKAKKREKNLPEYSLISTAYDRTQAPTSTMLQSRAELGGLNKSLMP